MGACEHVPVSLLILGTAHTAQDERWGGGGWVKGSDMDDSLSVSTPMQVQENKH